MHTDDTAPRYRLGSSDTYLSCIGLGTWQFSQGRGVVGKFWPTITPALILSIVEESLNHGVNWFDTAEVYGGGKSEEALAQALADLQVGNDEVCIATKWWPVLRSARHLQETIAERLNRLHGRPITLYQIHQPYSHSTIAQQMEAMARLIDAGLISHAGVSNFSARQMVEAYHALKTHGHTLVSNQVRYHLLDRRIERNGVMAAAQDLGISIIAYSPLAQGLLSGKFHDQRRQPGGMRRLDPRFRSGYLERIAPLVDALQGMARRYDVSPAQVALNWIITYPGNSVFAIPGARRVSQAVQNASAMSWRMTESDRMALSEVSASVLAHRSR